MKVDSQKILLFLISLKGILIIFDIDLFDNAQAEAIANGATAFAAVIIAIIAKAKEAQAKKDLVAVKAELQAFTGKLR